MGSLPPSPLALQVSGSCRTVDSVLGPSRWTLVFTLQEHRTWPWVCNCVSAIDTEEYSQGRMLEYMTGNEDVDGCILEGASAHS
jgi:hypothetical protein